MILYDLQCDAGHRFEAWFRSSADFDRQAERRLLCCAVCGTSDVEKAAMAPALHGTYAEQRPLAAPAGADAGNRPPPTVADRKTLHELAARIAEHQAMMLPQSRWVGDDFAREVRAVAGDATPAGDTSSPAPARPAPAAMPAIHGRATPDEVAELIEEGHAVVPLLTPFTPPDRAH